MFSRREPSRSLGLFLLLLMWEQASCIAGAAPRILITNLPPYNSFDNLSGIVLGANPASNAVAVFIYVPGYGWVSKPTCAQPLTTVQADGTWSPPVTIDRTPYATPGGEMRFGDYFGAQAQDGVLHVVHHPLDPTDGYEYIAYVAVRY